MGQPNGQFFRFGAQARRDGEGRKSPLHFAHAQRAFTAMALAIGMMTSAWAQIPLSFRGIKVGVSFEDAFEAATREFPNVERLKYFLRIKAGDAVGMKRGGCGTAENEDCLYARFIFRPVNNNLAVAVIEVEQAFKTPLDKGYLLRRLEKVYGKPSSDYFPNDFGDYAYQEILWGGKKIPFQTKRNFGWGDALTFSSQAKEARAIQGEYITAQLLETGGMVKSIELKFVSADLFLKGESELDRMRVEKDKAEKLRKQEQKDAEQDKLAKDLKF